jgi:hypothetical protein
MRGNDPGFRAPEKIDARTAESLRRFFSLSLRGELGGLCRGVLFGWANLRGEGAGDVCVERAIERRRGKQEAGKRREKGGKKDEKGEEEG